LIAGFSATAHAETYSFACISNSNAANCATGIAQLRVDVLNYSANQTLFQFTNIGADNSSIADICRYLFRRRYLARHCPDQQFERRKLQRPRHARQPAWRQKRHAGFCDHGRILRGFRCAGFPNLFDLQSGKTFGSESFINVATPAPEASQWLMLLLGFGLIAARTRNRQH
jgi:hypothetical protein